MDKVTEIKFDDEAGIIQSVVHKAGHWGNFRNNGNSWLGYIIVVAIGVAAFLFLILFS